MHIRKPSAVIGDFYRTDWEFTTYLNNAGEVKGIICLGHVIITLVNNENLTKGQIRKLKNMAW